MAKRKNKDKAPGWASPRKSKRAAARSKPAEGPKLESAPSLPPIYVDRRGQPTANPLEALGFPADAAPSREEVLARARALLLESPPERDPELARQILEARARLTDAACAPDRLLGELRVPDLDALLSGTPEAPPPSAPQPAQGAARLPARAPDWTAQARLAALMAFYALVEAEIEGDTQDNRTFDSPLFE